jgi:putative transposase
MSRAEAARRAGMERQALRDAVLRYNGEDLAGLRDRAKGRPQRRLTEGEEAALAAVILRGPEPERDGCCAWTRGESVSLDGRPFRQNLPPFEHDAGAASNGVLAPEGAPRSPAARHKSPGAVRKKGLRAALKAAAAAHPGKHLQLWFQDEARVGNKGRVCHRWWLKGERAPGLAQQGYQWAYIFSAVRPATGEDFTLVLPVVSAAVMDLFLAQFAATLPADSHAVLVLDGAGWHDQRALTVPDNLTLVSLPAYSPELNPVERIWLYLRERFLSLRFLPDTEAIVEACCRAWNALSAEPGRIRSLCAYPWIMKLGS